MNMINPVGWFEIPVTDMDRAKEFYESAFNIDIDVKDFGPLLMGWFPFDHQAAGATGSLVKADAYVPSHHGTLIYFSVEEIDDVLDRVREAGGKVINPKYPIGDNGFVAHFEDSEGNRVALHQNA